jgi:hypothetical protein
LFLHGWGIGVEKEIMVAQLIFVPFLATGIYLLLSALLGLAQRYLSCSLSLPEKTRAWIGLGLAVILGMPSWLGAAGEGIEPGAAQGPAAAGTGDSLSGMSSSLRGTGVPATGHGGAPLGIVDPTDDPFPITPAPRKVVLAWVWEDTYPAAIRPLEDVGSWSLPGPGRLAVNLATWPHPKGDNGQGLHWFPTTGQSREVVDRFVPELLAMRIKWVVFLNGLNDYDLGANDYLVQQLARHNIEPVLRVEARVGPLDLGRLRKLVTHYRRLGVHYFQVFNEPNLDREWGAGFPHTPDRFVQYWLPAARVVVQHGGYVGLAPMSPGGDYSDYEFLRGSLSTLVAGKEYAVLNRAWISVHNYTSGSPADFIDDVRGFGRYRRYAAISRAVLGAVLPMLGTEGGSAPPAQSPHPWDDQGPEASWEVQAGWIQAAYRFMSHSEPYFFCYSPWLIGNKVGGGHDERWESAAWFKQAGHEEVVDRVKGMSR